MTFFWHWMKEDEAMHMLKDFNEHKHDQEEHHEEAKKMKMINAGAMDADPSKLRTPTEIMWSLQVRKFTKKLLFFLCGDDQDGLEDWLLSETVAHIQNAIKDLGTWPAWTPEKSPRETLLADP